jgi:tetratricopeptide (TPR) repeat protein
MKAAWQTLPLTVRIESLMTLANAALAHDDKTKAIALLDEARPFLDDYDWSARLRLPLDARLAAIRHRAGDTERARSEADAALALYEAERSIITNIYRAGVLRPLAEAYFEMGDAATARAIYARALEEGVVNPNSRPRAEDLSDTCCSMARTGLEPDERMWDRIREIKKGLSHPW